MKDADELQLQINADEMCRTCLAQVAPSQLKPIFCNEILDGKIVPFPRVLETTVGIKPTKNEVFPNNVCVSCKTKLKELFSFKEKASKSLDLLYEIFGLAKPEPVDEEVPKKKQVSVAAAETQTDKIELHETDEKQYGAFLKIEKDPKPATKDVEVQVKTSVREISVQASPEAKKTKDSSVQAEQKKPELRHSEVQVDFRESEEELVEAEMEDDNFTHLDVIEENENEESEQTEESQNQDYQESEIADMTEQEEINFDVKSHTEERSNVKLEPLTEQDFTDDVEYLAYEVVEETAERDVTDPVQAESTKLSDKKAHECLYCQYVCDDKEAFNKHYAIHEHSIDQVFESIDYFRCTNCKYVYTTAYALEQHLNAGHCEPTDPSYFVESSDTRKHEEFHSSGTELLDVCLPKMKSIHKDHESQIFICGKCSLPFETFSDALDHYSSIHQDEEDLGEDVNQIWEENEFNQIHVCGLCFDAFKDASFIRQHIYFHKNKFGCPYGCSDYSARDFYKLTVHINRKHLAKSPQPVPTASTVVQINYPDDLTCNICSRRFTSKASYKVHTKNHFADRRYTCTFCPKAFIQKSDLTIHIRSHTDERPFSCPVLGCDKKFRTSSHRRDHLSTHAEEKKYQCEVCQKYFKAERILQGHLRLHSGFKPFECEKCGKSFSRKHHVKLHMKTHEKDVVFS